jgi:hypothetical protein
MIKTIAATALSAVMVITSIVPAGATSIFIGSPSAQVEKVQWSDDTGNWRDNYHRKLRPRPGNRDYRDYRDDRSGHWNGHRGYRDYHSGYRRHSDGWWYPLAAFGVGAAIIGGMAAQQAPRAQLGAALPASHVRWCQGRYRSYDGYSNTFQPYNGPRQPCVSPYYR